jgi:H+-transporting ATPase
VLRPRSCSRSTIAARELVPGDIVRIRSGDIVPADLKLLEGTLSVDQSALTGESQDIDKVAGDNLFSGSIIRRGEGNARVMLTGARTLFGRATELVQQARPKLHIEAVVARVVRWLFVIETGSQQTDYLAGVDGFAEVYPQDKYTVVQHLQAMGHVTGMTGDGVNDAPALRQAEVGIAVSTATDVAKAAASVVLTDAGLTNIISLVEQGRTIYQRILTWIINKISRTILKSTFVAIAYLLTGKFVVSAFAMLLLTFMTDFAKIAIATDHVQPSRTPEAWNIGGFVAVSVALGLFMVAEALALLWFAWTRFGLDRHDGALYTFSFLLLLYLAVFLIVSARERRWFWATMPSVTLIAALAADVLAGTALTYARLPGLMPLPWWQTLTLLAYAMVACLMVNDTVKVVLTRWLVPRAVA